MGFLKELGLSSLGTPYLLTGIFVLVFLFVIFMTWCLLPFAIFGIKDRLDELIEEQKKTNALLAKARDPEDERDRESIYVSRRRHL